MPDLHPPTTENERIDKVGEARSGTQNQGDGIEKLGKKQSAGKTGQSNQFFRDVGANKWSGSLHTQVAAAQ